jgi:predicted Ser/Thr protein kinase
MKISQLVLREDFYSILEKTIVKNTFFSNLQKSESNAIYKSFQYLNIIFNTGLPNKCKYLLVHEYTLSQSKIKMLGQKVYVFFAFLPLINNVFVHKRLRLPLSIRRYAIVGGNHRVRLFDENLKKINVLLKDGENSKFVSNDIECRIKNDIDYAPKILSFGKDWLIEEYISGVPFNRIIDRELLNNSFEVIVDKHMNALVIPTKNTISIEDYLQKTLDEIYSLIRLINGNDNLRIQLENTVKRIHSKIVNEDVSTIEISLTHGDFQKGNMRITPNNETVVIDWEAADNRFYLYDLYVLLSGIREGKGLKYGISLFFEGLNRYEILDPKYSKYVVTALLCLEELRFNMNEDISLNYFSPGIKSSTIAIAIDNLL